MFENIGEINFRDENGKHFLVKDFKETGTYNLLANYSYLQDEDFDEIITRDVFYGANYEGLASNLIDYNAVILYENEFNMDNIKTLRIPRI